MEPNNPLPAWDDELSVCVDVIDEDHQAFFRLAALMQDVTSNLDNEQAYLIETALNILEEYIEGHFLREQMAMAKVGYPQMVEHISAHDAFADHVTLLVKEYRTNHDLVTILTLAQLVADWLTHHIQGIDSQYKGFLTNENVDNRPLAYMAAGLDTELAP
ncbi:putative bacteriohemerythrin [Candidatus Terasakiella magnetica]|nr:putative bacteriohemerythrin [Candidatus Terasakiella magnetica]